MTVVIEPADQVRSRLFSRLLHSDLMFTNRGIAPCWLLQVIQITGPQVPISFFLTVANGNKYITLHIIYWCDAVFLL